MKLIAKAILDAQKEMGNATKDSSNPFFKSKYADLNSIREACMPLLNKHGVVVLQPTINIEGKNYVKTMLIHADSGETIESLTEIIYSKQNDAQSQGSGITYARRYGLQSLVNIGADDDDGNKASQQSPIKKEVTKPYLNENSQQFTDAIEYLNKGGTIEKIKSKYNVSPTVEQLLKDSILS